MNWTNDPVKIRVLNLTKHCDFPSKIAGKGKKGRRERERVQPQACRKAGKM